MDGMHTVKHVGNFGRKGYWDMRVGAAEGSHNSVLLEAQVVRYHADHVASTSPVEGWKLERDRCSVSNHNPPSIPAAACFLRNFGAIGSGALPV